MTGSRAARITRRSLVVGGAAVVVDVDA